MPSLVKRALGCLVILLVPCSVFAQATLTGTVKDTSGAVLPGVTVEASSPVLIEKTRATTTDGSGQFRIVDLRPGQYVVTFSLPGFNTVKRDGIELSGAATSRVDADLRVGAVEETVRVTGEAPIVDTQGTTRQTVMDKALIDAAPTSRQYSTLAVLIPGVTASAQDVGGSLGDPMATLTVHGSRGGDMRVTNNGVTTATLMGGGAVGMSAPNAAAAQEVTIDTSAVNADLATGGPRINYIPRDGGNTFAGAMFFTFSDESLQGNNFTDRLKARGLRTADGLKDNFDFNPAFGGPVQRDKVWFWFTGRYQVANNFVGGMFENKNANNPNAWTYEADPTKPAVNNGKWYDGQVRVTWQASPRNKIAGTWDQQWVSRSPFYISATRAPEAANDRKSFPQRLLHAEWSSPVSDHMLLEAVALHRTERWGNYPPEDQAYLSGTVPGMIPVTEQSTGLVYRGGGGGIFPGYYNDSSVPSYFYRVAASYITGAHAVKVGFNDQQGRLDHRLFQFTPLAYRFLGGAPNQVTVYATDLVFRTNLDHDLGIFAQDRWTVSRLTTTYGVRYDYFASRVPAQHLGPGHLQPNRSLDFQEQQNLNWKDVSPRVGVSYDLFGNGKTALKATANKYLTGQGLNGLATDANPVYSIVQSASRTWNDANGNYVVDCDLLNPVPNGECVGALNPANFGALNQAIFDKDLTSGFGNRGYNWEFSGSVQHEVVPRVSVDVGYFRRIYGNFRVTDNVLTTASDYTLFNFLAPSNPRLSGGGGYAVEGAVDVNPDKFGQVRNLNTLSDTYGRQIEHWNGFDFNARARLTGGLQLSGGVSTGKTITDNCEVIAKVPELLLSGQLLGGANGGAWLPASACHQEGPFLTQVKGVAVYMVPKIGALISGTFQSVPGPIIAANFNAPTTLVASSLGRPLSGNAPNINVNLVEPGSLYGERLNQLDLRFGKILRFAGRRATASVDLYNALNADAVLTQSNAFANWQTPQSIITARFVKFSLQVDF